MRAIPRASCLLILLLMLPFAAACDYKQVTVQIDDFEAKAVEGVRFWRFDDGVGDFVADGHVVFSERFEEDGLEWIEYTHVMPDGSPSVPLGARLIRVPDSPGTVRMDLYYARSGPGTFRVSTFNAMGESELSFEEATL